MTVPAPHVEAILHLVHRCDDGGNVAPGGVPLDVSAHEVLPGRHGLRLVHIVELQLPIHRLEAGQDHVLAGGGPADHVGVAGGVGQHRRHALHCVPHVAHVVHAQLRLCHRRLRVQDGETRAMWLPGEVVDAVGLGRQLEHLRRGVPLLEAEELERGVDGLLALGEAVHLNCQVRALGVPEHLHICDGEQVLLPKLGPVREADERDASRQVATSLLRLVRTQDGVCRGPGEVLHHVQFHGLFVKQPHLRCLVHADSVLAQPREELVGAAASPLEQRPVDSAARTRCRAHRVLVHRALECPQLLPSEGVEDVEGEGSAVLATARLLGAVADDV
mmetsp:Transcript_10169/g.30553  ORF Transcript_10169/g.30553 Transcript_10169/m.30553 type:complete len:332 (+) Transcript_10169:628-1623(+)